MRLAMVIGEQRLALEQRMLNRLAVGLMAEGIQITRIVPTGQAAAATSESEKRIALAPRIEAHMRSMPWMRRVHVRLAAESLAESTPDALYLLGCDAWAFGLELAAELDRPAILEVWSSTQAAALPRTGSSARASHLAAVTAPCAGIAEVVRRRVGSELTNLVPMGVSSLPRSRTVLSDSDPAPCIAVIGGARDVPAYAAMLNGLARTLQAHPSIEIFLELHGPHEHDIWRLAERAGLIGAISAFSSASHLHSLLTRCDILICPERFGELRSVLLEAMATAVPVIAAADPSLDMLVDGATARLVSQQSASAWNDAVSQVLADPPAAQQLGAAARERVLEQHRSSEQIARMQELLQRLVGSDSYAFPNPNG